MSEEVEWRGWIELTAAIQAGIQAGMLSCVMRDNGDKIIRWK